jgi:hypothetical protein
MLRRMRRIILGLTFILGFVSLGASDLLAQTEHGQAYAIVGPGKFSDDKIGYTSFGGEYIGKGAIGVAGEMGFLWGARPDVSGGPSRSTIVVSGLVTLRPFQRLVASRFEPFFMAGVGFLGNPIGDNSIAVVLGVGTSIWLGRHVGARADFRVPLGFEDVGGVVAGFGISMR